MKVEIILKDEKYCNGCPLLNEDLVCLEPAVDHQYDEDEMLYGPPLVIRPQACIDKNGA